MLSLTVLAYVFLFLAFVCFFGPQIAFYGPQAFRDMAQNRQARTVMSSLMIILTAAIVMPLSFRPALEGINIAGLLVQDIFTLHFDWA